MESIPLSLTKFGLGTRNVAKALLQVTIAKLIIGILSPRVHRVRFANPLNSDLSGLPLVSG